MTTIKSLKSTLLRLGDSAVCVRSVANTFVGQPALLLSPLILATLGYAAILGSPQGMALSDDMAVGRYTKSSILAIVSLSWTLAAIASWATLVSDARRGDCSKSTIHNAHKTGSATRLRNTLWVACLPSLSLLLLANATRQRWLILFALALTLFVSGLGIWSAIRADDYDSRIVRKIRWAAQNKTIFAIVAASAALVPLMFFAEILRREPMFLSHFGPLCFALLGINACTTLFAVTIIAIPRSLGYPRDGLVIFIAATAWALIKPTQVETDNPLLRHAARAAHERLARDPTCVSAAAFAEDAFVSHAKHAAEWSAQSALAKHDARVSLISAEGGGIRAAYWTAMNLAYLDAATNDQFSPSVASISGVSGGSLGIAAWLAAHERQD